MSAVSFALVLSLPVLFALLRFHSSPPEGWDGEEDEAGMMAERRGAALWSLVVGRSAARCGDVVAITSPRTGRGCRPSSRAGCWCDGGEVVSGWRWCGRWRQQSTPHFRADGGGILRPDSLFLPFCLLFCSTLSLLPEGGEGGGRVRGGKDGRPSRLCPSLLIAFVFPLYIIMYI